MLLSIIIINYKTPELTKACIDSIIAQKELKDLEIIVVDNGSGSQDVKYLQNLRDEKNFKFISNHENIGFAAGCNLGAQMAKGKNLLFINSDAVVEEGLMGMAKVLNGRKEIVVLGGKILNDGEVIEKSAGNFYNLWRLFLMLIGGERFGADRFSPKEFQKVDWVSGGFMMVKKEIFDKLSGFDEDYFMYLEDMDFCFRAKKEGYSTYYFPDAEVLHKKHGSSNRQFAIYNIYKSLLSFYRKNTGKIEYNIARVLLYLKAIFAFFIGKALGRSVLTQTYREVLRLF